MRSTERKLPIAFLLLTSLAPPALADVPLPLDRFSLSAGGFYPHVDSRVSVTGPPISDTPIDLHQNFDLDSHKTLANARLELLVFDSQGFSISGYQYSKAQRFTFARDYVVEGHPYDVDAFATAGLRIYTYSAAWHWWLQTTSHDVLGLGLGAAYYQVKGTIDAGLTLNRISLSVQDYAETSQVAPLLTVAWRHAFSENLRAYVDFSGVRKDSGTLTGHLLNGTLGAEWYPFHNFGIALEYSSNALSLKARKDGYEGRASIDFKGPAAFVRMRF